MSHIDIPNLTEVYLHVSHEGNKDESLYITAQTIRALIENSIKKNRKLVFITDPTVFK